MNNERPEFLKDVNEKDLTKVWVKTDDKTIKYALKAYGKYFVGTAICKDCDTFNEEKGKRIAKLKAIYKMKKYRANELIKLQSILREYANLEEEVTDELARTTTTMFSVKDKIAKEVGIEIPEQQYETISALVSFL